MELLQSPEAVAEALREADLILQAEAAVAAVHIQKARYPLLLVL